MIPAIFLDRDGVIIENKADYVRSWVEVKFLPGALAALARLKGSGFAVVIVTNQSAIGRGILTGKQAEQINQQILGAIRSEGGRVDGVYLCPHAPAAACSCRKPRPGLLLQAAADLSIDLARSWMIGDALSDIQAGQAAETGNTALVLTGRGRDQIVLPEAISLPSFHVFENLSAAVDALLAE